MLPFLDINFEQYCNFVDSLLKCFYNTTVHLKVHEKKNANTTKSKEMQLNQENSCPEIKFTS
eukprot:m.115048 g.115048  ORF g.115048 m.115048 type:complete len:62 (+) comp37531_c1_seq3:1043-1228(+)